MAQKKPYTTVMIRVPAAMRDMLEKLRKPGEESLGHVIYRIAGKSFPADPFAEAGTVDPAQLQFFDNGPQHTIAAGPATENGIQVKSVVLWDKIKGKQEWRHVGTVVQLTAKSARVENHSTGKSKWMNLEDLTPAKNRVAEALKMYAGNLASKEIKKTAAQDLKRDPSKRTANAAKEFFNSLDALKDRPVRRVKPDKPATGPSAAGKKDSVFIGANVTRHQPGDRTHGEKGTAQEIDYVKLRARIYWPARKKRTWVKFSALKWNT